MALPEVAQKAFREAAKQMELTRQSEVFRAMIEEAREAIMALSPAGLQEKHGLTAIPTRPEFDLAWVLLVSDLNALPLQGEETD